jgi:hypothetical protein
LWISKLRESPMEGGLHPSSMAASQIGAAMAVACTKATSKVTAIAAWDLSIRATSKIGFRNARPKASNADDTESD